MSYEACNLKIKTITPVNISNGTILNAQEYLYYPKTRKVYFLNHLLWHNFIYKHNLFSQYETYMTKHTGYNNLYAWLSAQGYSINDLKKAGTIQSESLLGDNLVSKRKLNDIICGTKLINGDMYIPGSSIKGIFRTAILYKLLQENPQIKQRYWREICFNINNKKTWENFIKHSKLEIELLHLLNLSSNNKSNKYISKDNAVCSTMRGLICSDAVSDKTPISCILQKRDIVADDFKLKTNTISVFRECIIPNEVFNFNLKIDTAIMREINISSIDDLLNITDEFFDFVNSLFKKAFQKQCPQLFAEINLANIYIGGGTGFLTKTLIAALAPNNAEAISTIAKLLDYQFRKAKHPQKDRIISPRTLKIVNYNGKNQLAGLAKVYR